MENPTRKENMKKLAYYMAAFLLSGAGIYLFLERGRIVGEMSQTLSPAPMVVLTALSIGLLVGGILLAIRKEKFVNFFFDID